MFYGARRDVANLRPPDELPLGITPLDRWYLQLVPGADPLASNPVAEAEGVQDERAHPAILAHCRRPHQYDR